MKDEMLEKVERTTAGLRELIFSEIDALRSGTTSPQRLRAIAAASNAIIRTVVIEMALQSTGYSLEKIASGDKIGKLRLSATH